MWKIEAVIMLALVAALVGSASGADRPAPKPAEMRTDLAQYPQAQQVKIDLVITNTTSDAQEYTFSSGKQFDIWITRDDSEVWRWSRGHAFIQVFTHLSLQPGESKTFSATWDQRDVQGNQVPAGSYVVSGQLTPTGEKPAAVSTGIKIISESSKSGTQGALNATNSVTVLGEVMGPGRYPVTAATTVRDAIEQAGGLADSVDVLEAHVWRAQDSNLAAVDIKWAGNSARSSTRFLLRPGDCLYVDHSNKTPAVMVLGEVVSPGQFRLRKGLTLMQAVSMSGGFTDHANKHAIIISRRTISKPGKFTSIKVDVAEIIKGRGADPKLARDDVVWVSNAEKPTRSKYMRIAR
jgi:protein involved in polysaccharide export with SLBB domain